MTPKKPKEKTAAQKAVAQLYALSEVGELEIIVEHLLTPEQVNSLAADHDMDRADGGLCAEE